MKNLLSNFKSVLQSLLTFISFVTCMYLSVIFFLILMADATVKRKQNEILKEDFAAFIQKISDFPTTLFSPVEKKEVDLSRGLF